MQVASKYVFLWDAMRHEGLLEVHVLIIGEVPKGGCV